MGGSLYGAAAAPDTSSTVFPGRAIKPLPRRSLRDRLPDDAVSAISFPPAPVTNFSFPFDYAQQTRLLREKGDTENNDSKLATKENISGHQDLEHHEDSRIRSTSAPVQSGHLARSVAASSYSQGRYLDINSRHSVTGSVSATSSADSYESFENTNNKKRKIPTPSNSGHHSQLSHELANISISSTEDSGQDGYGTVSQSASGHGYASTARRNYARHAAGRSPLAVSTNGSNWSSAARRRFNWSGSLSPPAKSAGVTDTPVTPIKGSRSAPSTPEAGSRLTDKSKTQFTFTYETSVPTNLLSPATHSLPPISSEEYPYEDRGISRGAHISGRANSATQTSLPPTSYGYDDRYSSHSNEMPLANQPPPPQTHRKLRNKRAAREAARQRRLQELNLSQNPQDFWICEFCEYESIFGVPPEALVRQYDIKDRRERRRLAEQKRLLEKAKMKGRKGRKSSKAAKAAQNNVAQSQQQLNQGSQEYAQEYPRRPLPPRMDSQTTQSDEFDDEDYLSETPHHDEGSSAPPPLAVREKTAVYDPNYVRKKPQGQENIPDIDVTT